MFLKMRYNIKTPSYSIQWTGFLLLFFSFILSCKNYENRKHKVEILPLGTWRIIDLKSPVKNIVFHTATTYFVEHQTKNKIVIQAKDNRLSGELIPVNKYSFKMENLASTDVCCNSEDANLLFKFFFGTIKKVQVGNKLILSSNKTVITLEK